MSVERRGRFFTASRATELLVCRSVRRKRVLALVLAALGSFLWFEYVGSQSSALYTLAESGGQGVEKKKSLEQRLSSSNKPPLFAIIHIGPRKTGTSSIQYALSTPNATDRLAEDGFEYLGKWPVVGKHWFHEMMLTFTDERTQIHQGAVVNDSEQWKNFLGVVEKHRSQRKNIIMSNEAFPWVLNKPEYLKAWRDALEGFDVKIVVTYRRPFEWLLSEHFQELLYSIARGWDVSDLVVWFRDRLAGRVVERGGLVDAGVVDQWRAVFPNVYVFNYHNPVPSKEDNLLERFCCQALMPEAPVTCTGAQHREFVDNRTGATPYRNKSSKHYFDALALAVRSKQLQANDATVSDTAIRIKASYTQMTAIKRVPTTACRGRS